MGRLLTTAALAAMLGLAAPAHADLIGDGRDTVNGTGRGSDGAEFLGDGRWDDWCGGCGRPMPRALGLRDVSDGGSAARPRPRPVGHGDNVQTGGFNPGLIRAVERGSVGSVVVNAYSGRPMGEIHVVNGNYTYFSYTGTHRDNLGSTVRSRIERNDQILFDDRLGRVLDTPRAADRPQPRPRADSGGRDRPRDSRPTPNPDRPSLRGPGRRAR